MELSDGPQFPRIERILRSKGLLKKNAESSEIIPPTRAEGSLFKSKDKAIGEKDYIEDKTHDMSSIGMSASASAEDDLEVSAESLIKRSKRIPVLLERSIFDGLSTRARALVYHGQEEEILRRVRKLRTMRNEMREGEGKAEKEEEVEEPECAARSWNARTEEEIVQMAIAVYKKPFMNRKWRRVQICQRRGKGRLAELYRDFFFKKIVLAALIKNMADPLKLDTSDDTDENSRYFIQAQNDEEDEEEWETLFDETHQAFYYYNHTNGESRWREDILSPVANEGEE